jgi:transposase InsO family protein
MRELGLAGKAPVQRKRTTNSNHDFKRYPNLMMRLVIKRLEQVWVGDITYIRLQQEFVYLTVLMDVFTRSIRGWHLARSMDVSLTITALNKGLARGRPEGRVEVEALLAHLAVIEKVTASTQNQALSWLLLYPANQPTNGLNRA